MATSLYTVDLNRLTAADVQEFLLLRAPVEDRPPEGTTLDYKREVSDDIAQAVAMLANSYGGLVIVGVEEENGRPTGMAGVARGPGELKTRIVSKVLATMHPAPDWQIGVCAVEGPGSPEVAVIRVREGRRPPYMFTKDQQNLVQLRDNARGRRATVADLEALFARRIGRDRLREAVRESYPDVPVDRGGGSPRATSFLRVGVQPVEPLDLVLDRRFAAWVEPIIGRALNPGGYPRGVRVARRPAFLVLSDVSVKDERARTWWLGEAGGVFLACEATAPGSEDVVVAQLAVHALAVARVARRVLAERGYFGELHARLELQLGRESIRWGPDLDPHVAVPATHPWTGEPILPYERLLEFAELDQAADWVGDALFRLLVASRGADIDFEGFLGVVRNIWAKTEPGG